MSALLSFSIALLLVAAPAHGEPRLVAVGEALKLIGKSERVRIQGTLLYESAPGWFCIGDGSATIRGQIDKPFSMQPGDRIEVVSVPEVTGSGNPWLWHATGERLGKGEFPSPLPFIASDAYLDMTHRNRFDAAFVTLQGRVTGHSTHQQNYVVNGVNKPFIFNTIEVEDHGVRVLVIPFRENELAERYPVGSIVAFTGTCRLDPKLPVDSQGNIHLLLPDASHSRLITSPPFWLVPRYQAWMKFGGIGMAAIAALMIAMALGKWRALQRAKATLESRVAERTAELQQAHKELATALDAERELSHLKSQFVSMVSHEFRTPLGVIGSSSQILNRYFTRLDEDERREHLESISASVDRMAGMMEDVLILSHVDSGRMEFKPAPVLLDDLCHRLIDELHSINNGTIHFTIAESAKTEAQADETLLRHILTNLLTNAHKYSPPDSPVQLNVTREGNDAVFIIRDEGIGIPAADQAKLFDAFHRGSNVGHVNGTGLGLVIVKRCVTLHGGSVSLQSTEGKGSTFTVRLPLF